MIKLLQCSILTSALFMSVFNVIIYIRHRRQIYKLSSDLKKKLKQTKIILDTIPSPIFCKDEDGRYTECNSAFSEFIGLSKEEIINRTVFEIGQGLCADSFFDADMELMNTKGKQVYETKVKYNDGTLHDVLFSKAAILNDKNEVEGAVGVMTDVTERKLAEKRIELMSQTDYLTDIYNRRGFLIHASEALNSDCSPGKRKYMVFYDMDNLKKINDKYGHDEGDRAITKVASLLKQCYGKSDIIGRLGGDEFAVLCICSPQCIEEIISRLNENINEFNEQGRFLCNISISYGYVEYEEVSHGSVEEMLKAADEIMYNNKKYKTEE